MTRAAFSLAFLIFVVTAPAAIFTLNPDGSGDYLNIQVAIDDVNDGDVIVLMPGTYTGNGNRNVDFKGTAVTVRSTNPAEPNTVAATVIDCNGSAGQPHRAFYFHQAEDANSVVDGITIIDGYAAGAWPLDCGGAILCTNNAAPGISNCAFVANTAQYGGAVYASMNSAPTITNCTFTANHAISANGALSIAWPAAPLTVENCLFENNTAALAAGAAGCTGPDLTIIGCTFIGNSAMTTGALYADSQNLVLKGCNFTANSARQGIGAGAVTLHCSTGRVLMADCTFTANSIQGSSVTGAAVAADIGGNLEVKNCLFQGNSATGTFSKGGAAYIKYGSTAANTLALSNCTFAENTAERGGGIYLMTYGSATVPDVNNCILWQNSAVLGDQLYLDYFAKTSLAYSDCLTGPDDIYLYPIAEIFYGLGNITDDPCFVEPGYWDPNGTAQDANDDFWLEGDYRLLPDSPCINAGDPCYPFDANETDLDANPRIGRGRIDMGPYEFPNATPVAVAGPNQTAFAGLDQTAAVTLDGTGSYDDDGDPLTCVWSWTIASETFNATGPNPTITLPTGTHTITLTVNDGLDDSGPNCLTVTVVAALETVIKHPLRKLNCKSGKQWLNAYILLPQGLWPADVDTNTAAVFLPLGVESQYIEASADSKGVVTVELGFLRQSLCAALTDPAAAELAVTLVGSLTTGQYFYATEVIEIMPPRKK